MNEPAPAPIPLHEHVQIAGLASAIVCPDWAEREELVTAVRALALAHRLDPSADPARRAGLHAFATGDRHQGPDHWYCGAPRGSFAVRWKDRARSHR